MCIVTYLPLGNHSFILVSSREELPSRASCAPTVDKTLSTEVLYPKDETSNGTWIIAAKSARVACLLNGAFEQYEKAPFYKHSRGLLPLKYMQHKSFLNFYFQYDLAKLEPFTLIACEDKSLFELRWDGLKAHVKTLIDKIPHIWSSPTLYNKEEISGRERRFVQWTKNNSFELENIFAFHKQEKNMVNERSNNVQTLSVTGIHYQPNGLKMIYEDQQSRRRTEEELKF